jgi:hypothetical protein
MDWLINVRTHVYYPHTDPRSNPALQAHPHPHTLFVQVADCAFYPSLYLKHSNNGLEQRKRIQTIGGEIKIYQGLVRRSKSMIPGLSPRIS